MQKAVFFDRDGTLIVEKHYIKDPEEVELYSDTYKILTYLKQKGFLIIVISNQSGIARGYLTEEDFHNVNKRMIELLGDNYLIDGIYFCPHHPDITGECECRKPKPGMVLKAKKDFNIDLSESFVVGDKVSDVKLVETAKLKKGFLLKKGHGIEEVEKLQNDSSSLLEKVEIIDNLIDLKKFI